MKCISSSKSHGRTQVKNYKWYFMGERPLQYDVRIGSKVVIPAGTKYVGIAFGQSHLTYETDDGTVKKMNVYRVRTRAADGQWKVMLYHA